MKKTLIITLSILGLALVPAAVAGSSLVSAQYNPDSSLCSGSNLSVKPATPATDDTPAYNPCTDKNGDGVNNEEDGKVPSSQSRLDNTVKQAVNVISIVVGIIAVIAIIIGGAKFITSGGDSGKIASAKNSVIYAIVGLIVVALAQVIVRFVLNKV